METIRAQNNGYPAEISVVTFSLAESGTDESAKFRVLLVNIRFFLLSLCWEELVKMKWKMHPSELKFALFYNY